MDRRDFTRLALAGFGASLFGSSIAKAVTLVPENTVRIPGFDFADQHNNAPAIVQPVASSYAALLNRAKAALDMHGHRISLRDRVALADFNAPSGALRFHIVDLLGGNSSSYLVSHGRGSDPGHSGWLRSFSNAIGSLATSNGAYMTGQVYHGQHGQSLRLEGLDPQNSNAATRAIVIHGADYVNEAFLARWGKLGRSEGCFAFSRHIVPTIISKLGQGRLLYADKI